MTIPIDQSMAGAGTAAALSHKLTVEMRRRGYEVDPKFRYATGSFGAILGAIRTRNADATLASEHCVAKVITVDSTKREEEEISVRETSSECLSPLNA